MLIHKGGERSSEGRGRRAEARSRESGENGPLSAPSDPVRELSGDAKCSELDKTYLTLSGHTDDASAILKQTNNGGSGAVAFEVLNHTRLGALHDGHARVGRSQIDTNDGLRSGTR